jgi:FHS family L-fucose permease-like MFS transporter
LAALYFRQEQDLVSVKHLYITIGAVIAVIAIAFAFVKVPALTDPHVVATDSYAATDAPHADKKAFPA